MMNTSHGEGGGGGVYQARSHALAAHGWGVGGGRGYEG